MLRKLTLAAITACAALMGQTTITDTLRVAPGNGLFAGRMVVTAPEMVIGTTTYAPSTQTYTITSGAVSVSLMPNDAALPTGTSYGVQFYPSSGSLGWAETWYVPTSGTALKISDVRTRSVTSPNVARLPLVQLGNVAASGKILMSDGTKWAASDPPTPAASGVRSFFSGTAPIVYNSSTGAFSCPTCGTGATWGSITGTLSAQADLQSALDGKSASSHAHSGIYAPVSHAHSAADVTSGTLGLSRGGTGNATWTAGRCVQVSSDGTKLEVAAEACGSGSGGGTVSSIQSASASFTLQTSVTVTHNFNSLNQVVACRDGSAVEVKPSTVTAGLSATVIAFTTAETGACTVIGGTGLYSRSFISQTSVTLSHGLGTQSVIAACYNSSNELVEPSSFTATSTSAATVTFSTAQTGACVVAAGLAGGAGGGSEYTLPTASADTLGGVKIGSGVTITDGVISVAGGGSTYTAGAGIDITDGVISTAATVPTFLTGAASLTFATFSDPGNCEEQNITVPGAAAGDAVDIGLPQIVPAGIVQGGARVSTANTVTVRLCRLAGTGTISAQAFRAWVNKTF